MDTVFNHTIIELENITLLTSIGLYAGYMNLGFGHEITDYLIPIQGTVSTEISIKHKVGFHITSRTGVLIHGVYDWYSMISYSLSVGGGIRIYITPNIVFTYTLLYNMTTPNGYVVDIIDEEVGVLFRLIF